MNIEEKRKIEKMYEKGLVEISSIIEPLIENFKIDRCSIDIQQCQLVIDYLIRDRDFDENYIQQLEEELEKEKRENQKKELAILNAKQIEFNKLVNTVNSYKGQFKRQQKEIEELKENNGYHLGFIDGGIAKRYEYEDKIKAKIEEVSNGTFDAKIVLQSLLEKE